MDAVERTMVSWDGSELFYRAWQPEGWRPERALLLFHRGHEHSGRWQEMVDSLGLEEVAIFAWDARGHGRSPGERGAARELSDVTKDVDAFVRHIAREYGIALQDMILLAHSLAAVTVGAWVHDYGPPIRGLILATAAFEVKLYVPFALAALRLQQKVFGAGKVKSYVRATMLTHDPAEAARYDADPLIFRQIATNVLVDLHETAQRLLADAGAIQVPTLMLAAGKDWVVSLAAQRRFFNGLSSPWKQMNVFPAMYHAIFHEQERAQVIERVREFVRERFAQPPLALSLRAADRSGYTWEEFERLKLRGGPQFLAMKAALRVGGRFSKGIGLGWESGFDSGRSLDYVYKNRPHGSSPLGKFIDANYLKSIGWRGIRERKANLEEALRRVIEMLHAAGRPIRILDVAAGAGRYVLETMRSRPEIAMSAILRDYREENVAAARALADELELQNVSAELGDAFDRASLAALNPPATIGVVSGLYELFPGNDAVLESLGGLAAAIEPDGYLVYTNQPWHPQLEFIARVLRNREGRPWIMRRRTTAEIDELVRAAGFEKCAMEIDRWGMFTVAVARRLAA
ncbi:MAG TPA: bifunctional alpha/beta hydrolase/class I SAM-dependent methyltransferase [Chthoniobacterales bacterium]|nr:bifunctional alpha/beta hydrolase/class I SAM-dependent methyltransferase [Chthoniobacterales bacterium]